MLGSLTFAAVLSTAVGALDAAPRDAPPLDAAQLKAAMQETKEAAKAAQVGRAFRIEIPFVDGRKRDAPTFQSPARWVYDFKHDQLDLIIGPGEVTPSNYDQFAPQGLDKLPPLQSFVFDSRQVTNETAFTIDNRTKAHQMDAGALSDGRGDGQAIGKRSWLYSFAIAVPYDEKGVSGLPTGFKPLSIHKVDHLPQRELRRYVSHMTLVLEGEITDLGQQPPTFCGGFQGGVTSKFMTGDELISLHAKQCFVTARIDKVTVMRGGETLASWPRAPATAE
jgi:hypothetical protein